MKQRESHMAKEKSSKISTERKLALIQSIRKQNQINQNICKERERILYGGSIIAGELYASENNASMTGKVNDDYNTISVKEHSFLSGFRMRFVLSMILFVLFVFAQRNEVSVFGKSMEEIEASLKETFEIPGMEFLLNAIDL